MEDSSLEVEGDARRISAFFTEKTGGLAFLHQSAMFEDDRVVM